jgi:hypothetical protein
MFYSMAVRGDSSPLRLLDAFAKLRNAIVSFFQIRWSVCRVRNSISVTSTHNKIFNLKLILLCVAVG